MQDKTLKCWSSCCVWLLLSISMHSVYLISLKAVLLKMALQMLDLRKMESTKDFFFFLWARDLADCFLRNIFLLCYCLLVNTDASFEEIYLWDWKRKVQIISETFCVWFNIEDTKLTAVFHSWRVKPRLDVIFQFMTDSGSISHK